MILGKGWSHPDLVPSISKLEPPTVTGEAKVSFVKKTKFKQIGLIGLFTGFMGSFQSGGLAVPPKERLVEDLSEAGSHLELAGGQSGQRIGQH